MNQYTSVSGLSILYGDGRGNLTVLGGWNYTYDAENHLIEASGNGHDLRFYYDAMGRIGKVSDNGSVNEYRFYDGSNQIERVRQDGSLIDETIWGTRPDEVVSRYVPGYGWHFYHQDPLESTVAITDSNGSVIERYLYDGFGAPRIYDGNWNAISGSAYGNPWMFTGQEYRADMGAYNYKARFYSPDLGRFMQNDSVGFSAGDLNLYRYCDNNPINLSDSTGNDYGDVQQKADQNRTAPNNAVNAQANPYPTNNSGETIIVVTPGGNGIPVGPGQTLTGSPDGKYIQVRNPDGTPSGIRIDGGHKPEGHPDPKSQAPHAHRPDVTDPWRPLPVKPEPAPIVTGRQVAGGVAAVGAGYLIYRGVRMIPSVAFPPLWPTIPINAAVP